MNICNNVLDCPTPESEFRLLSLFLKEELYKAKANTAKIADFAYALKPMPDSTALKQIIQETEPQGVIQTLRRDVEEFAKINCELSLIIEHLKQLI